MLNSSRSVQFCCDCMYCLRWYPTMWYCKDSSSCTASSSSCTFKKRRKKTWRSPRQTAKSSYPLSSRFPAVNRHTVSTLTHTVFAGIHQSIWIWRSDRLTAMVSFSALYSAANGISTAVGYYLCSQVLVKRPSKVDGMKSPIGCEEHNFVITK